MVFALGGASGAAEPWRHGINPALLVSICCLAGILRLYVYRPSPQALYYHGLTKEARSQQQSTGRAGDVQPCSSRVDLSHEALQGGVVSFDPAHDVANYSSVPVEALDVRDLPYNWPARNGGNGDRFPNARLDFGYNFEEFHSRAVTRLWRLQRDGATTTSSLVVVGTPAGQGMLPFVPTMLKPFTQHPWALANADACRAVSA
ncbi:hypothetical protein ABPG75_001771 [Micractinium tetrahymenae]